MNILIKFSGEFFDAKDSLTPEGNRFLEILKENNIDSGYFVIGGGNRIRGRSSGYQRSASDNLGVISTIMNGFILEENLRMHGFKSALFSHFHDFGKIYMSAAAKEEFAHNKWVILASGLGRVGHISTDLSSVIKALELNVDMLIKITKIGGVYDKDPALPDAKLLSCVSYDEVLEKKLGIMDLSAIAIAAENNLKIAVIDIDNFINLVNGQKVGSIIYNYSST